MSIRPHAVPVPLLVATACLACAARADWAPDWISAVPVGSALSSGLSGLAVGADGMSYLTGINGPSFNTDMITVGFAPDGSTAWQHVFNGPGDWHDQARAVTLGPDGTLYVTGNTPGAGNFANVALLAYDAASGGLVDSIQYSSELFTSEHGGTVAADAKGNVFVGGGTVGDGADGLMIGFDASRSVMWSETYDGPAFGPYSQDNVELVEVAPDGNVVAMVHGVMNSLHPDYVVIKYDAMTGGIIWQKTWGTSAGEFATDMEIDANGDVYVTGTALDFVDKFSTIKLRGTDGQLLWQEYDVYGIDDHVKALALDDAGGVYITGQADPDGDQSNFNDDFYTIKRSAETGAQLWTHHYGDDCVGCFDDPNDVIVDSAGNVLIVGSTSSPPYSNVMILFRLDAATGLELDRSTIGPGASGFPNGSILRFDGDENIYIGGGSVNYDTGAVSMAVYRYASLVPPAGPEGDGNGDGIVDVADLILVIANWGGAGSPLDFSGNGIVDVADLVIVIQNWS